MPYKDREAHRDRIRAIARKSMAKKRAAHSKEEHQRELEYARNYRKNNPEKFKAYREKWKKNNKRKINSYYRKRTRELTNRYVLKVIAQKEKKQIKELNISDDTIKQKKKEIITVRIKKIIKKI